MAKRLLPGPRDYSEHDVVNMYALNDAYINENITGVGYGDQGVFVAVASGNFDLDPVSYVADSYLGNTSYPHVGVNEYPKANLRIKPAVAGDTPLGITLWETAKYDENGEKLLYYRQKAREMQVVLPGQAVPVATRGLFALSLNAIDGTLSVGGGIQLSTTSGKITGWTASATSTSVSTLATGTGGAITGAVTTTTTTNDWKKIGVVLGTGSRTPQGPSAIDQFSGNYAVVRISC